MKIKSLVLAFALLLMPVSFAHGDSATIGDCAGCTGASDNNNIYQHAPTFNYGTQTWTTVGWLASTANTCVGIERFDLTTIPAGSTISAAAYHYYTVVVNNGGVNLQVFGIHDNNNNWVEGTVNGSAEVGSSCYNKHTYNTVGWAGSTGIRTSGTDYYATNYGALNTTTTGAKTLTINATGITYLERKCGSDGAEFKLWTNTAPGVFRNIRFGSSEEATDAYRPYLSLTYTPPAAGGGAQVIVNVF